MAPFLLVWGLLFGSLLNVIIRRLPKGEPIVYARSHCPRCRHLISWYDNIPLLSFLLLRRRCRHCGKKISWRYPLVELLTAVLFLALGRVWDGRWIWMSGTLIAAAELLVIAFIDWDTFLIPDILSVSLWALGIAFSYYNPYFRGGYFWVPLAKSLGGSLFGFLFCWGIAWGGEWIFKKEAMGGGDIKLLAAVGAWSGIRGAFNCLMIASLLGSAYGLVMIVRRRLRKQDPIPFGPFLSAAAIFNLIYLFPIESLFY